MAEEEKHAKKAGKEIPVDPIIRDLGKSCSTLLQEKFSIKQWIAKQAAKCVEWWKRKLSKKEVKNMAEEEKPEEKPKEEEVEEEKKEPAEEEPKEEEKAEEAKE